MTSSHLAPDLHAHLQRWSPAPDLQLALEAGVVAHDGSGHEADTMRRVRRGTWSSYGGVVVQHNAPLTSDQRDWVAVLRAGDGAVLGAASAMRRAGVAVDAPPRPQVVVPWSRTAPRVGDVDLRRSRLMTGQDVHPTRQPPQFRLSRATVDAASLARRPDDVRALLCAPVQQRLLKPGQLRVVVLRLGPVTGRALMLRTLDDVELGAQSTHELRFTRALRRAGLPPPDRQTWRQRPDGRRYLDCWWEAFQLHVEIDGLAHFRVTQWVADLDRTNELEISASARRLRIVGFLLWEQQSRVLDQVRRALQAGGWTG
jgi:very-short-patch-repair endonuclease